MLSQVRGWPRTRRNIVFVALASGKRDAFIGDLTWRFEGIEQSIDRPLLMELLADSDRKQVRTDRARMIAFADQVPVVPAHDTRGFTGIPPLPAHAPPNERRDRSVPPAGRPGMGDGPSVSRLCLHERA